MLCSLRLFLAILLLFGRMGLGMSWIDGTPSHMHYETMRRRRHQQLIALFGTVYMVSGGLFRITPYMVSGVVNWKVMEGHCIVYSCICVHGVYLVIVDSVEG